MSSETDFTLAIEDLTVSFDGFKAVDGFVLDLAATHRGVGLDAFAEAIRVPVATLKDWLAGGLQATRPVDSLATAVPQLIAIVDGRGAKLETLSTHAATLEDLFVALTGRELRDA